MPYSRAMTDEPFETARDDAAFGVGIYDEPLYKPLSFLKRRVPHTPHAARSVIHMEPGPEPRDNPGDAALLPASPGPCPPSSSEAAAADTRCGS